MAVPFLDSTDKRNDFTHIVDFCTNLKQLQIVGSNIPLGRSTIIPNQYDVDLSPFKSLEEISFKMANFNKIAAVIKIIYIKIKICKCMLNYFILVYGFRLEWEEKQSIGYLYKIRI